MDTGIFSWFGFLLDNTVKFKLIAMCNFSYVSLWWGNEFDDEDNKYYDLPKLANKFALKADYAHFPYHNINRLYGEDINAKDMLSQMKKKIDLLYENDMKVCVIHPYEYDKPVLDEKRIADVLTNLGEYAYKKDIKIALENTTSTLSLINICEKINLQNVGYCYDSGHYNIEFGNDFSALKRMKDKIFAYHLHDNDSKKDAHLLLGEGNVNKNNLKKIITENKNEPVLLLETIKKIPKNRLYSKDEKEAYEYLLKARASLINYIK